MLLAPGTVEAEHVAVRARRAVGHESDLVTSVNNVCQAVDRVVAEGSLDAIHGQSHPNSKLAGQDGAKQASQYRAKQDTAMKKATERDLSDPYYWTNTATWTWTDLGW